MTRDITGADSEHLLDEGWSTPLEAGVRGTIRGFIEVLLEEELEAALGRARYARLKTAPGERAATRAGLGSEEPAAGAVPSTGHRHGRRERQVMGSFGAITVAVPRARLDRADGRTTEWVNKTLPAYRRRTREVDALIAGAYLAGTNTRRVGRALTAVFRGAISRSTVSRVWRQIKADWESWNRRDLDREDIVRLILDGTVVKVRLDRKATTISLLKRWLLGTHAGAIGPKHLQAYLDEYAFRHNRRKTNGVGRIAARVIQQLVARQPLTMRSLIDDTRRCRWFQKPELTA